MKTLAKSLLLFPLAAVALAAYDRAGAAAPQTPPSVGLFQPGVRSPAGQRPAAKSPRPPAAPPARVPDGVKAHRDLAYAANGHQRQKLDLFLPEKSDAPLPLIIWVHGGGWQSGSKEQCLPLRLGFAERGYAVASIGYRLSGDAIFPAQIEDCKAAIRWLRAHAGEYNLDADHFGVWGSSAGGHLVALLGTAGDAREFDKGEYLDLSSRVQAVCDYYGPTDLLQMDAHALPGSQLKHDLPTSPESRLIGGAIQENRQEAAKANPIAYLTKDAPPFLIVHGDQDPLVPQHQSRLLSEALQQAGVPCALQVLQGARHGGPEFTTPETLQKVFAFFDKHLNASGGRASGSRTAPEPGASPARERSASMSVPRPGQGKAPPAWVDPDRTEPAGTKYCTFRSKTIDGDVSYLIYLPPDYEAGKDRRYPVVYWLHGIGGTQRVGAIFVERLDAAIRSGEAPPMIAVLINGMRTSFYNDSADGKVPIESVLIKDLIPHVDATYRTVAGREGRVIEGFSMGAYGATHLGFKYPELFGAVSCLAGALRADRRPDTYRDVFGGKDDYRDANSPFTLLEKNIDAIRGKTRLRIYAGEQDPVRGSNVELHETLDRLKIEHEYGLFPGVSHDCRRLYEAMGQRGLAFFAEALGGAPGVRQQASPVPKQVSQPAEKRSSTAPNMGPPRPGQPRGAEPSWLMPPVEAPNLFYKTFNSKTVGQPVSYLIYLPPDYEKATPRRYPVVYWLHGIGGSQQGVPTMAARLTKAILDGKSPPMIVVYVNGAVRSGYVDSADGKWPVETVTIKELIPHIDAAYRTIATREGRAVEGFSMGGGGAAKWGCKYPELFGTVSILAGAMHDAASLRARGGEARIRETYGSIERFNQSNPWLLVENNREALRGRTVIRVVVGEKDGLKATNERFHELLDKLGLKHEFHVIPGAPHSPNPLYDGLGEKNWSFFRDAFASRSTAPSETSSKDRSPVSP